MCRLYGFRANEPTKVECSLVHAQNALLLQSRSDMMGREHADGWGLASYRNGEVTIERRDSAAFEGIHFSSAAERIHATTVLAHVRRATVGAASPFNTHPFRYGRWTFAHNGTVSSFDRLREGMVGQTNSRLQKLRRGTTDSEQTFLWILTRMERAGLDLERDEIETTDLASVLGRAIRDLDAWTFEVGARKAAKLNFILTNGRVMIASRWNHTLHWVERVGLHDCEICGIPHIEHDTEREYRALVIASEPITDEPWQELDNGSLLAVGDDLRVEVTRSS